MYFLHSDVNFDMRRKNFCLNCQNRIRVLSKLHLHQVHLLIFVMSILDLICSSFFLFFSCSFSNIQSSKIVDIFDRVEEMSSSGTISSLGFPFSINLSSFLINLFPNNVCVVWCLRNFSQFKSWNFRRPCQKIINLRSFGYGWCIC